MKAQVYIKQRYLAQVKMKDEDLKIMLSLFQGMLILLIIAAVRSGSLFLEKKVLYSFGDAERYLGPFDCLNFLKFSN